jgi:hypothetical protein
LFTEICPRLKLNTIATASYFVPKSLPTHTKLETLAHPFETMQAGDISEMGMEEQPVSVKRGWRFHGTFGTLALINLICAIDATILLVALPVRDYSSHPDTMLIIRQDNSYRFERHHCHPSFLGRDFVSLVSSRQPLLHHKYKYL